jgi:putative transposase
MCKNRVNVTERRKKNKDGTLTEETVHFPDFKVAFSKKYKDRLIEQHPIIQSCPQGALTTNVGLKADLKKAFGKRPVEQQNPQYYNERHPRLSYTYQESLNVEFGENKNVFHIKLSKIGLIKVRGWNRKLRFENETTDFLHWAKSSSEKITVVVSKDTVGDYYIVFKLKKCLKPFREVPEDKKVGVDVGIKDIAITSDGQKFENKRFKKQEKQHQKRLNRKLSRRWGPSNEEYRKARKKKKAEWKQFKEHPEQFKEQGQLTRIQPSKGYLKVKMQHAKLNRKINRKRDYWNHCISRQLVEQNQVIAVESLNITGMVRNKHLSYALTDASFGSLLANIKYKAEWHGRTVKSIDKWTPSSKRCSVCGYIYNNNDKYNLKAWNLGIRTWTCPKCETNLDRDINAAKNILYYAENAG